MMARTAEGEAADRGALRGLAGVYRRHRRSIAATILIVLALTSVAYAMLPRRFTAHGSVWLDHRSDQAAMSGRVAPPAPDDAVVRNTEMRVLTSPDLAGRVVDKLGLARMRGFGQPKAGAALPPEDASRLAIAALRDGLRVKAAGPSFAAAASYSAADPALAAGILNQTIDQYVDYRRNGGARGREREVVRQQIAAARDDMIRAEAAATGYRTATSLIGRRDPAVVRRELSEIDRQIAKAETGRVPAADPSSAGGGKGMKNAAADRKLEQLRAQQAELTAERSALAEHLGMFDPQILAIDHKLADVNRAILRGGTTATNLGGVARNRVTQLAGSRGRLAAELEASDKAARQLAHLEQAAATARNRHASLVEHARQSLAADRGSAYVIAHAGVPAAADFPSPLPFALGGTLAALIAAAAVAAALELLPGGFRTRPAAERKLGIPVIGMVPDLAKLRGIQLSSDEQRAPLDYLVADSRSPFSAAFRSIHTGLRLGGGAHSPRSVAVSSALPEEGKTTVAICLARSAALAGLRVVFVDCDVRRPAASRSLAEHVEVGLVDVLEGSVTLKQALLRDAPSGAWFLPNRTDGTVANDLIGSNAMAALVAELVRDYDLVVLDTAPALALAEARVVAAMADRVVLVARTRRTPIQATRIALDLLTRAEAKVDAAVLTFVDP